MILGVDPGKEHLGFCVLDLEGRVYRAGKLKGDNLELGELLTVQVCDLDITVLCVEQMHHYKKSARADDLIPLARLGGEIMGRYWYADIKYPIPDEWKGRISKDVHHRRLDKRYPELVQIKDKDVKDACGLAKWAWSGKR